MGSNGKDFMLSLRNWARRIRQLPLLFNPPADLRRRERRHDHRLNVLLRWDNGAINCTTINLSSAGILLDARAETQVGHRAELLVTGYPRRMGGRIHRLGASSTVLIFDSGAEGLALLGWAMAQEKAASPADPRRHVTMPSAIGELRSSRLRP